MNNDDPLLAPIHGVSLRDYAAACMKLSAGVTQEDIFKALGIDEVVWGEVNTLWTKRMQADESFSVINLFGQLFGEAAQHPVLGALGTSSASAHPEAAANLERLQTDRYFYEELNGARRAAYDYGLDGAQWIADHFGINLGDFQRAAMHWMQAQNQAMASGDPDGSEEVLHFISHQEQMRQHYAERFAAEQGGNVADDIEF